MKRNFIKLLGGFVLVLGGLSATAQDVHFTQYRQSPLTLNPANTGAIFGDFRLGANYRNQWSQALSGNPISTYSLGFDKPIFLENSDRVGIGFLAVSDQAGDLGFNTNRFGISGSYIKLVGYQEFRFGLQAAYTIRSIDKKLSFPEGFNKVTGEFDASLTELEPLVKFSSGFFDLNLGIGWSGNFGQFKPEVGIAAFHLNGPKETFFAQSEKIAVKMVGNVSLKTFVTKKIYVDPNLLIVSQAGAKNFILGINGGIKFKPNDFKLTNVWAGIATRNGFTENSDAVLLQLGIGISNFDFGASYDVNTSALGAGITGNGSVELSLIYTAPSTRLIKTKIDSERL